MKQFSISGTIKHFKGDGRKLGYPTANIDVGSKTPEGQFAGKTELNGKTYESLIFIGAPVTMGDPRKRAEAHILDFKDKDLYGISMTLHIEYKIRDNRMFESSDKLVEQIAKDILEVRKFYSDQRR